MNNEFNNQNNKNDKWKDTLIAILVIIVFILTTLSLYFIVTMKDNDVVNNKDNIQEENKENSGDNENILTKYLKYVPYLDNTLVEESYDDAYSGKNVNINEINKNILLYSAITNTKKYDFKQGDNIPKLDNGYEAFSYYKVNDVVDYLNNAYNIDNLNMPNKIKIPGGTVLLQDNYYLPILGAGSMSYEKFVYSTNYYEENDKLIIEEEVLFYFVGNSICNVYANTSDMHEEKNVIDTFSIDYTIAKRDIDLRKYTNKTPTKYKHTFKKIDNEYVWYSTEVVENNSNSTELNCEIKVNGENKELYVNDKKVNGITANNELGSLDVKEFKDLLIVDEMNPGPSRRLLVVDKNGNATEIDYKVSTYNAEFINSIDSYRVEGNNLYIKVNRQWGNGYVGWYCRYEDNNEVAEYEVKYEYVNGKLENKEVLNEVTIKDKYKNEKCN